MLKQKVKKRYNGLNTYLVINLSQSNKCQDEWMLHLYLVDQNILTSGTDIGIEQQWPRNRAKQKHVQEDEEDKEKLEPFWNLKCQELIIRKRIIATTHVDIKDHVI